MANPAFNTLMVRTLTGVVLLVVVLGGVLISPLTFVALILVICMGAMGEFYNLAERTGAKPQRSAGVFTGSFLVAATFLVASVTLSALVYKILLAVFLAGVFAVFIVELYRKSDNPILNIGTTLMGILYVAVPLALLTYLPFVAVSQDLSGGGNIGGLWAYPVAFYRPWVVLCYIFIVWINDIGAYLFGVAFGKHRLFERISPKKSWEGFFGGLITAVALGLLCGWLLMPAGMSPIPNMIFWGGLSSVVVISAVFGDLIESMFKRSIGVKDSGSILPGHGGFLDRFDALIYSAPFVFLYFIIFAQ